MTEFYIAIGSALISGGMALLGVCLTNFNANKVAERQRKAEQQNYIRQQKEALYYKIFASLDMGFYENGLLQSCIKKENISDEDIEILLLLYAPDEVIGNYHYAMEAVVSNFPIEIIVQRLDVLKKSIHKDLGVKEVQ